LAHAIFTALRPRRGRAASLRAFFSRLLARCLTQFSDWSRRNRERRLLQRLDARALRDLGIDRAVLDNESAIPFWSLQSSRHTML
jgi:uncharacterized protein YjiS (DUF1127 family)